MRVYLNKLDRIISISSLTDEAAINDLKIATVTINCNSAAMKRFILSKGDGITIKDILDESVLQEQVEKEFKLINQIQINQFAGEADINAINSNSIKCKNCGRFHEHGKCPAFGKTCHKCNKLNHFAFNCQTPSNQPRQSTFSQNNHFSKPQFSSNFNSQQHSYQNKANRNHSNGVQINNIGEDRWRTNNHKYNQYSQHPPYDHQFQQYEQDSNHQSSELSDYQSKMYELSLNESNNQSNNSGRPTNSGYYC